MDCRDSLGFGFRAARHIRRGLIWREFKKRVICCCCSADCWRSRSPRSSSTTQARQRARLPSWDLRLTSSKRNFLVKRHGYPAEIAWKCRIWNPKFSLCRGWKWCRALVSQWSHFSLKVFYSFSSSILLFELEARVQSLQSWPLFMKIQDFDPKKLPFNYGPRNRFIQKMIECWNLRPSLKRSPHLTCVK